MKAVVITSPGGPEVLQVQEVESPKIADGEVLIKVAAAALNMDDLLQRQGKYSFGFGLLQRQSKYLEQARGSQSLGLGLECSGTVEAVGKEVSRWKIGDQVCALLNGGGYAEKVAVPADQVLPIPEGISLVDAASFPEVACTIWFTVFWKGNLLAGETFLVHGRASGAGAFAIQLAKHQGARVLVIAGREEELAAWKDLGADVCINYNNRDFLARVMEETGGKGVDVVLDSVGESYFQNLKGSLSRDCQLFLLGFKTGTVTVADLGSIFTKRGKQQGGMTVTHPVNRAVLVEGVEKNVWPVIAAGKVKPLVYKSFPLSEAAEAHRLMESNQHIGKILLIP